MTPYFEMTRPELEDLLEEAELAGNDKMVQHCMARLDELDNTEEEHG